MKHSNDHTTMNDPRPPSASPSPDAGSAPRFYSLRSKFVAFFSVTLIVTASALSWYFVETRRTAMVEGLHELGTVLLTNTLRNDRFRFAGLVAEDPGTVREFVESLMAIDHVAYVVITGGDGVVLAQQSKLVNTSASRSPQPLDQRLLPPETIAKNLRRNPVRTPQVTRLVPAADGALRAPDESTDWIWPMLDWHETLYDFAISVLRRSESRVPLTPLELDSDVVLPNPAVNPAESVTGVVQIGLTDAIVKEGLMTTIRHVMLLTALLIIAGIIGTHLFTKRITTPLQGLAAAARRLAEGTAPEPLVQTTRDEVGQLTGTFNMMTQALHERNLAITNHLDLIRRQVGQLTTVHETSSAIAHTLDLRELMDTILQLLMANLGFSRMVLMLRRDDPPRAYVARVAGISQDIMKAARLLEVPILDDGSILSDLFLHATPMLVPDIELVAHRMHPETLAISRQSGVASFVAVPLQSKGMTLGMLGADRGDQLCTKEDLTVLTTIAGHVASAIDNARAYSSLEDLTQHLEQRIRARTEELSIANERLKDHDRRRTMFVSTASHELRTPMTAIRSFTDNMLDGVAGALNTQQTTYLNRIAHNLNRLTRIINQLLDWSALDLKKEKLQLEPLCIRQITSLVVDSIRTVADKQQTGIELELPERLPPVLGDRDKLEQILWNLIGNAVKFTPSGGRVSVSFETLADSQVRVCIADTGCGIAPEFVPRIFDEFSKVPSVIPASQGAQLGLFITKTYVEMHRGRIWAESHLGVGTRFYFTLPFAEDGAGPESSSCESQPSQRTGMP